MIVFDDETQWSKGLLSFWARRDKRRIHCMAGLETIAKLPGFTHAKTREIGTRRTEVRDLLKPQQIAPSFVRGRLRFGVWSDGINPKRRLAEVAREI
jgi:hypothetical protein